MSPHPLLPAGQELVAWLKQSPGPSPSPRLARWLYRWRALGLSSAFHHIRNAGPANAPFPFREGEGLVFIMGFWRSGTTLLHEILAELPGWEVPRTWQCMDPACLATGHRPNAEGIQRPMDGVVIAPDSPQEDEFALMALGVPSLYRAFLDPRRLPELHPLLAQEEALGDVHRWGPVLDAFLAWCHGSQASHMAVKSPNHVFRHRALAARYPRARRIWLLRDPQDLWTSNLKMWRAMMKQYGLWPEVPGQLETFLTAALQAFADLLAALHREGEFARNPVLAYESLVRDPQQALDRVFQGLGGPDLDPTLRTKLLAMPKPGAADSGRKRATTMPESLQARLRQVQEDVLG